MKKYLFELVVVLFTLNATAQEEFGVFGSLDMSTSSASQVGTNFGGNIGGLYNLRLTETWWVQPRLILGYQENEAKNDSQSEFFASQWSVSLPVLMSCKVSFTSNLAFRVNAGPYLQYAAFGRDKRPTESGYALGWWHLNFGNHFTYGFQTGIGIEYGPWISLIDFKHSMRRSTLNMGGFENTLMLGIGYQF